MSNVVDFVKVKKSSKAQVQLDPLARAKEILSAKEKNKRETLQSVVKRVKNILRSKSIKYRVTNKELNSDVYQKDSVILFPEYKLIFMFSPDRKELESHDDWAVEMLHFKPSVEAIEYVAKIISFVEELKNNVTKQP